MGNSDTHVKMAEDDREFSDTPMFEKELQHNHAAILNKHTRPNLDTPLPSQYTSKAPSTHLEGHAEKSVPPFENVVFEKKECLRGWIVLIGVVLLAASNMGLGMAQGVLQAYYATGPYASTPESVIALVGGLIAFHCTLLAQVGGRFGDTFGFRPTMVVGIVIGVLAIVLDAISTKMWQVFLTQGVMYGLGQALTVPLFLSLPSQWFFEHRALATGIVSGSGGLGGALTSLGLRYLITHFQGTRDALLVWSAILAIVWGVGWFLVRENRPTPNIQVLWKPGPDGSRKVKIVKRPGLGDLRHDHVFWSLFLCVLVSCFGYLCPFAYISTYTKDVVIPKMDPSSVGALTSTWPLFCCNIGLFVGRCLIGYIADRIGSVQCLVMANCIAGLLQIAVWRFAITFNGVMVFSFFFGLAGGASLSLIAPVIAQIYGVRENMASAVGFTMLASAPGSLSGPTIAGCVLSSTGQDWHAFQAVGGSLQLFGGLIGIWTWWYGIGPMKWGNKKQVQETTMRTDNSIA